MNINKLRKRCLQKTKSLLKGMSYRHIDNGSKILAVAHCDSVTCNTNHFNYSPKTNRVYSTRLDDRLGVYIILDLLPAMGIKVDVLLTDDEEVGRSTAQFFETDKKYNWMFQFDRRGTDAVCYDYDSMKPYLASYFKPGIGSFSDICFLEHLGCAGLNIGTGYYNEHTLNSYANLTETMEQVKTFAEFYHAFKDVHIAHERGIAQTGGTWEGDDYLGTLAHEWGTWEDERQYNGYSDTLAQRFGYRDFQDFMDAESLSTRQEALDMLEDAYYTLDHKRWT